MRNPSNIAKRCVSTSSHVFVDPHNPLHTATFTQGGAMYHVYILTNRMHGTLYTGITSNLPDRVLLHRIGHGSEFVKKYGLFRLVYAEPFDDIGEAIAYEKRLKKWKRVWKIRLIETHNPDWRDLYEDLNL